MAITTSALLPPPVQQAFNQKLLSRQMPNLIHSKFAMKKSLASRNGNIIRMRRYNRLTPAVTPLGPSGTTPPGQTLGALNIDAQIQWYGTHTPITDQVTLINQDPVLNETASLLSQCLRETEDMLVRNMLQSTASVLNCVGGVNGDVPTELTRNDLDVVRQALVGSDARKISRAIEGADKFGTAPVREAYFAMMHTDLITDLEAVNGFVSVANYGSNYQILGAEEGTVGNTRFVASSQGSLVANGSLLGNDYYNVFIAGEEAYACIDLEDANAEFIYRPLGSGDDPLLQRQSAGFKFAQAQVITNDSWLVALRTTRAS
jgi:N4-gp56 family major capsid protein